MILTTSSGEFPIPIEVAERLPTAPSVPDPAARDYEQALADFETWLEQSPQHAIDLERLRRWHLVQDEMAATAAREGRPFTVTADGLE